MTRYVIYRCLQCGYRSVEQELVLNSKEKDRNECPLCGKCGLEKSEKTI